MKPHRLVHAPYIVIVVALLLVFTHTVITFANSNETSDSDDDGTLPNLLPITLNLPVNKPVLTLQNNGGMPPDPPFEGGAGQSVQEQMILSVEHLSLRFSSQTHQSGVLSYQLNDFLMFSTKLSNIEVMLTMLNHNVVLFSNLDTETVVDESYLRGVWQLFIAEWQQRNRAVWVAYTTRNRPLTVEELAGSGLDLVVIREQFNLIIQCRSATVCSQIAEQLWPRLSIDVEHHAVIIPNLIGEFITQVAAFKTSLNTHGVTVVEETISHGRIVLAILESVDLRAHRELIFSLVREHLGTLCHVLVDPFEHTIIINMPLNPDLMMRRVVRALPQSKAPITMVNVDINAPTAGAEQLSHQLTQDYSIVEQGYEADDEASDSEGDDNSDLKQKSPTERRTLKQLLRSAQNPEQSQSSH